MSTMQARLASAILLSVAASAGLMAGSVGAARAEGCITVPKGDAPQGKHWYYRIERGSGRHCWYLRGEDEGSARTPSAEPVASAKPAPPTADNAPTRSLSDAHAEFAAKAAVGNNSSAPTPPSVWPDPPAVAAAAPAPSAPATGVGANAAAPMTPANSPPSSPSSSPWPQPSAAAPTANAAPQASQSDQAATAPAPAQTPQASPPPRQVGSLQKLALVVFGALALAGITGSLVYRLAGARSRRRRQEARWPQRQPASPSLAEEARGAPWIAPELSPTVPHEEGADHLDVAHEDVETDSIDPSDDNFEKIEDFLARLTQQLQDEIQTLPTELERPRPR